MKKALLIGINNYPSAPLRGCVNDVIDMSDHLMRKCGFSRSDIQILTDERATKAEILEKIQWLLQGVNPEDRIIFHFSGHGVQMPALNVNGEVDGLDEAICPYDFKWTNETTLRDKEFKNLFSQVPQGTLFTWISDSCHSGDLHRMPPIEDMVFRTMQPPLDIIWQLQAAQERGVNLNSSNFREIADHIQVLLLSGCQSHELSADARFGGRFNGALTYYLLQLLENANEDMPMTEIVMMVNAILDDNRFTQNPQLQGSQQLMQRPFLA